MTEIGINLLEEWYAGVTVDPSQLVKGEAKVIGEEPTFYLTHSARFETYRVVLGYYREPTNGTTTNLNPKLKPRLWYFSGSEGVWRASTGFRKNGAWKKGAEGLKKHRRVGYVMENIVTPIMNRELESFWQRVEQENKTRVLDSKILYVLKKFRRWGDGEFEPGESGKCNEWKKNRINIGTLLSNYLTQPNDDTLAFNTLITQYDSERKYTEDGLIPSFRCEDSVQLTTLGSTNLQLGFAVSDISDITKKSQEDAVKDPLYWIIRAEGLWSDITTQIKPGKCINTWVEASHQYIEGGIKVKVFRVQLGDNNVEYDIEICQSVNAFLMQCKDHSGVYRPVETPYCWVRNVRRSRCTCSSFGTPAKCPINLAFMVQKPMDYSQQTSLQYQKRIFPGLTKRLEKMNRAGRREFLSNYPNTAENDYINDKTYINLTLFNEVSSPVICAYKQMEVVHSFADELQLLKRDNDR
ncbi:MAG: hypothetical protein D3910_14645 [Candidatus Electrothrix sp. ATG2]|nr:hypothetical protein [Candidatus Electrothrix sp. ATG2]